MLIFSPQKDIKNTKNPDRDNLQSVLGLRGSKTDISIDNSTYIIWKDHYMYLFAYAQVKE